MNVIVPPFERGAYLLRPVAKSRLDGIVPGQLTPGDIPVPDYIAGGA